jgi:signal transduction histidine kinase
MSDARPAASLQRLLTGLIWLCLLPLVLLAAALSGDHLIARQQEQDRRARERAESVSETLDDWLMAREAALQILARGPDIERPDRHAALYAQAQAYRQHFGGHLALVDASGRMWLNTRVPFGDPLPPADHRPAGPWAPAEAVATGRPVVSDRFVVDLVPQPMILLAVPVLRGLPPGMAIVNSIELNQIQKLLDSQALPEGHGLRVRDSQGQLLAERGAGWAEDAVDHDRRGAATQAASWRVELSIPLSAVREPLWRAGTALAILWAGAAALGLLGGRWAGRRLTDELKNLTHGPVERASHSRVREIAAAGQHLAATMAERDDVENHRREQDRLARQRLEDASRALQASREELQASHASLQKLVAAQDRVQEDERRRIARELHDDLQQSLAAILIEAAAARQMLPGAECTPMFERIDRLAESAIESTRRIVHALRPQALEELGLVPALRTLAARFSRQTGIWCELAQADALDPLDAPGESLATSIYRVAQEALNNVSKHAQARHVRMYLSLRAGPAQDAPAPAPGQARWLRLQIEDDGRGMQPEDRLKPEAFGLVGMRERVLALGGTLSVRSEPGLGTSLVVDVPL